MNERFDYCIVSTKNEEHKLCYESIVEEITTAGKETGDQGRPLRGGDILVMS